MPKFEMFVRKIIIQQDNKIGFKPVNSHEGFTVGYIDDENNLIYLKDMTRFTISKVEKVKGKYRLTMTNRQVYRALFSEISGVPKAGMQIMIDLETDCPPKNFLLL